MKIILFLFFLLTLVSCNSANEIKPNVNNEKKNKTIMRVTTELDIKVEK